ncbi:MAG TPA: MFS transporter, partial [Micromonosporaceae bacterium]
ALTPERSGVGSALIQAIRQVGGVIGVALLGTILNAGYRSRIDDASLPAGTAAVARRGVTAGVQVADGSARLLDVVRAAFVHAMNNMLVVSAVIAVAGAVLAIVFLRRRPVPAASPSTQELAESTSRVGV